MALERDAVVAGSGQGAAGLEVTGWLCQVFDSAAQHPAIRVSQTIPGPRAVMFPNFRPCYLVLWVCSTSWKWIPNEP